MKRHLVLSPWKNNIGLTLSGLIIFKNWSSPTIWARCSLFQIFAGPSLLFSSYSFSFFHHCSLLLLPLSNPHPYILLHFLFSLHLSFSLWGSNVYVCVFPFFSMYVYLSFRLSDSLCFYNALSRLAIPLGAEITLKQFYYYSWDCVAWLYFCPYWWLFLSVL